MLGRRFDLYGIYVVMFLEILRTLLQVMCVFSILIIAFGLAFYTIMYTEVSGALLLHANNTFFFLFSNILILQSMFSCHQLA